MTDVLVVTIGADVKRWLYKGELTGPLFLWNGEMS